MSRPSGSVEELGRREIRALTDDLKAEARRLGFDLVGVTTPEPPPHLDVYGAWLREGRHGEMSYLATERARRRRADPLQILPECKSILVLGSNYLPPSPHPAEAGSPARVAAYAQGDDYHEVLVPRLEKLVAYLESRLRRRVRNRIYTDTGPLLERELAQRAGLGWIGKNTCLIHPERGSYFLLSEVLLEIPLAPDPPMQTDHCGSCTLCIQACPTQCILPDRTLDARRCISYLTIEVKGPIPRELRPQMQDWLFGCDICQQVCPWNERFAESTPDEAFQPRAFLRQAELSEFLGMEGEVYRGQLRKSPLKRAKRWGLLRNASVAAGNRQDASLVPLLSRLLLGEQAAIARAHAAWALGRIGSPAAAEALERARHEEPEPGVREEIEAALGDIAPPSPPEADRSAS